MDLRLMMSQLADADARKAAARWLFVLCALGFAISMTGLAALGNGVHRWLFVLLFWAVLVFIPLRILLESLQTVGVGMRRAVAERIATHPRRYDDPAMLPVVIRALSDREAILPRICKPQHAQQAREAAVAIVGGTAGSPDAAEGLRAAIRLLLAATAQGVAAISAAATGEAADNIQTRWEGARALGALGALVRILGAAYADRWGINPEVPELEDRALREYLDAVLDYCDEAALQVDALPWTEPPLASQVPAARLDEIRATWHGFLAAGTPAPRALAAFVGTLPAEPLV
jgi:hypothetical protein